MDNATMKKIVLSILIPVIVFGACFGITRSLSGSKQSSGSPEGAASAASGTTGNTEGAAGSAGGAFVRDKYIDSENAENVLILIYDVKKGSEENEISYPEWVKEATAVSDHLTVAIEEIGDDEWGFAPAQPDGAVRLIAKNGKLEEIGMDGEDADGSKEDYLYHFLNWAKENQKADRTFVILSGHGGGIVGGFGMTDATSKDGMSLESIANILKAVDAKYDTVIFDACLEGSLETAYAMEPYADYMLASEQTIPLSGMDFSKAFHMLAENPAVPTEEVGRNIIKSFDKWNKENALVTGDRYTLSLVDLTMCQTVYQDYGNLMNACLDKMIEDQEEFFVQSSARSLAYDYNYGENDQADMGWIISRLPYEEAATLRADADEMILFSNSENQVDSGLAVYFPYRRLDYYARSRSMLENIGYTAPLDYYDAFASILNGAYQSKTEEELAELGIRMADELPADCSGESWYKNAVDSIMLFEMEGTVDLNLKDGRAYIVYDDPYQDYMIKEYGYSGLLMMETDEQKAALYNSEEDLSQVDGPLFLVLGCDNLYEDDENGDVYFHTSGVWLEMDGVPVPYMYGATATENGRTVFKGTAPAVLNGDTENPIEIEFMWDTGTGYDNEADASQIRVTGYRKAEDEDSIELQQFKAGDTIDFLYKVYGENRTYLGMTSYGHTLTAGTGGELKAGYGSYMDKNFYFRATLVDEFDRIITSGWTAPDGLIDKAVPGVVEKEDSTTP